MFNDAGAARCEPTWFFVSQRPAWAIGYGPRQGYNHLAGKGSNLRRIWDLTQILVTSCYQHPTRTYDMTQYFGQSERIDSRSGRSEMPIPVQMDWLILYNHVAVGLLDWTGRLTSLWKGVEIRWYREPSGNTIFSFKTLNFQKFWRLSVSGDVSARNWTLTSMK